MVPLHKSWKLGVAIAMERGHIYPTTTGNTRHWRQRGREHHRIKKKKTKKRKTSPAVKENHHLSCSQSQQEAQAFTSTTSKSIRDISTYLFHILLSYLKKRNQLTSFASTGERTKGTLLPCFSPRSHKQNQHELTQSPPYRPERPTAKAKTAKNTPNTK